MKLDLNPTALAAFQDLQNNTEQYLALIEDTCDYIIENTDEMRPECKPHMAISLLRYLRKFGEVIKSLEGGE